MDDSRAHTGDSIEPDWAFSKRGYGVIVLHADAAPIVLEFNELLRRIADGRVEAEDRIVARVFTDGKRRRVGDLRLFTLVRSGEVRTNDLPRRAPDGVLARGVAARALLQAIEGGPPADVETLLRATVPPAATGLARNHLRAAAEALMGDPPDELLRPLPGENAPAPQKS